MSKLSPRTPGMGDRSDEEEASEGFIAVGIDFGTTFSGVSWAFSGDPTCIDDIRGWPNINPSNYSEPQVPTQFDLGTEKWGYEITADLEPLKWFKLLLLKEDDQVLSDDVRNSDQLRKARLMLSRATNVKPVDIVGRYLKKLWNHALRELQSRIPLDSWPLRVAITVPAIWPPYAHKAMREAAAIAGITDERDIGETTLDLIQEPEAAGLWSLFEPGKHPEIQEGESFVVCDAGGGTVDVISYTVQTTKPFKLTECVEGAGNLSGAFRVDEAFQNDMLAKKNLRLTSLKHPSYSQFLKDWETGAKRTFSKDGPRLYSLRVPPKAFRSVDRLRGKDSFSLTYAEMRLFFDKSLTGIRTLIKNQYTKIESKKGKPPTKILLVGGLGDSPYIYEILNEQFQGIVLRPSHPWSAVARGAVIRLLHDNISNQPTQTLVQSRFLSKLPVVTARKSRYSYGIIVEKLVNSLDDFDRDVDKTKKNPEGDLVTERMDWYLRKGEEVAGKKAIELNYYQFRTSLTKALSYNIKYSSSDNPPIRPDKTVLSLCFVKCDWDKPFEEWSPVGDPDKGWRKHDDLALAMSFEGEPKWKVRVGAMKAEQKVDVEYMG